MSLGRVALVLGFAMPLAACALIVSTDDLTGGAVTAGDARAPSDASGSSDSADGDAGSSGPNCDPLKPFNALTPFPSVINGSGQQFAASLTTDGLTMAFASDMADGKTHEIYQATRPSLTDEWRTPVLLTPLSSGGDGSNPFISADGLAIAFDSSRAAALAGSNLWGATRSTIASSFSSPVLLTGVNSVSNDIEPWLTGSTPDIYFSSDRDTAGGFDLFTGTFMALTGSAVHAIDELNTPSDEEEPIVTYDELTLYFSSDRMGGAGAQDIWKATRTSKGVAFGTPVTVGELNSAANDYPTWISVDGCNMVVQSYSSGKSLIYYTSKPN